MQLFGYAVMQFLNCTNCMIPLKRDKNRDTVPAVALSLTLHSFSDGAAMAGQLTFIVRVSVSLYYIYPGSNYSF